MFTDKTFTAIIQHISNWIFKSIRGRSISFSLFLQLGTGNQSVPIRSWFDIFGREFDDFGKITLFVA